MPKRAHQGARRKKAPSLEWSVVGTLAWFGVLGRALTLAELHHLILKQTASEGQLAACIKGLGTSVVAKDGLYSLAGSKVRYPDEELLRWYRYKWWRARLAVKAIRWIPFIRMVGVANTLADKTAGKGSDIDVFIVIKHGRLYFTRTLITMMLQATGLRRHGRHIANRVCLSFFATTGHLDLEPIAFKPYDPYLAYWVTELIPVFDTGATHQRFLKANQWVRSYLPNYDAGRYQPPGATLAARFWEKVLGGLIGEVIEDRLAGWQKKRIDTGRRPDEPDVQIIATDSMLKFHEKERRNTYRKQWEALMRKHGQDPTLLK